MKAPRTNLDGSLVEKTYAHPNLNAYVLANRSQIVTAIMTLIVAYWRECQRQGGRPKKIEPLCAGRRTRFKSSGVDFVLDCVTWFTSGRLGSTYNTFANRGRGAVKTTPTGGY